MDKEQVKAAIEKYHQDNFWSLYPAGKVPDWVNDAVVENIVKPLQAEIEGLKQPGKEATATT
jgi:hypothetical protein